MVAEYSSRYGFAKPSRIQQLVPFEDIIPSIPREFAYLWIVVDIVRVNRATKLKNLTFIMGGREAQSRRILLVDDNPVNVQVGTRLLSLLGYEVDSTTNGSEAVTKACGITFDLILMDCQMPGLDGLSATQKIREYEAHFPSRERNQPVPIIALTTNVSESNQADCRRSGMDGFLSKPLEITRLQATLLTFLG
ncbi:hypothetical protein PtA15_5A48 [Puccinia triticina]|uniref:Response regulatory domain-containing protein n=1 Tax=Puccinia triticina TaxID=208348 RepID=A0ABY7CJE1_9BASI|nr:uncharacterized protein PtA15_5A48 [Puccinia triticina]WAQ84478.1 hypothetical protein PtA15_5A48 [Puccinia triticina]